MSEPISRYPVGDINNLPEDLKTQILQLQEKTGFMPNVFLALAHRPDELRAFMAYTDAVMERDSGITKAEKEMIIVATSAANDCLYCVVSHGAILRIRSKDPRLSDQIAINYRHADISDRQKAMLEFAVKLSTNGAEICDADFAALHGHGFSDEDIWDIGAVTSLFALSNRMAHLTAMRPNDEFYTMAR